MVEWLGGFVVRWLSGWVVDVARASPPLQQGRGGLVTPSVVVLPVLPMLPVPIPNHQSLDSLYLLPARPPRAGGCSRSGAARFRHAGRIRIADLHIVRLVGAEFYPALAIPPPAGGAFLFRYAIDCRHRRLLLTISSERTTTVFPSPRQQRF